MDTVSEKSYSLDRKTILKTVAGKTPGAYVLTKKSGTTWEVCRIQRSNSDIQRALLAACNEKNGNKGKYRFMYSCASSLEEAFNLQCVFYHCHGIKNNPNTFHPQRAVGTEWNCPMCSIYGNGHIPLGITIG
ncbi:MAG: hypothetical protein GF401_00580 [Chitinivibrionales bacterium]|nr:hypothetical protein [Chitinivibrionales bacterium]